MTADSFYESAVMQLEPILFGQGFLRIAPGTYRRDQPPTFLLVHLAEDNDSVMPRLSVGLPAVSQSGVVVSTDLHVLVSPDQFFWYSPTMSKRDAKAQLIRDFTDLGLPWLRDRASIEGLTGVFEERVRETRAAGGRAWWQRIRGGGGARRPSPFDLKVLSHCYELQGRTTDALDAWHRYLALLAKPGEADLVRLAQLERGVGGRPTAGT
jgi:hypothetical protein